MGPRVPLPGGDHAVMLKLSILAVSRTSSDEVLPDDLGHLRTYGLGQVRLEYHRQILNHTFEAGLRCPAFWWNSRTTNIFSFKDASAYEGLPLQAFVGYGY
jgi:hypothetical protein